MASYRKHYTQFTFGEKEFLWRQLFNVGFNDWKATNHLLDAMFERGAKLNDVVNTIINGHIVEYHQKNGDNRILLRGTKHFLGDVLCVVFQPEDRKIITAYWNSKDDKHDTINMSAYIGSLDITSTWDKQLLVIAS